MRRVVVIAIGVTLLGACAAKEADWNRYPGLREGVLLQAAEKDCQALTDTVNLLRLGNDEAKARWGSDNEPIIREIERKATVAGCRNGG